MLVGREAELKQLENFYKSKKAEFLAIYGRRRVGKSFLIQQFYSKKSCVSFHTTGLKDGTLAEQIDVFTRVIGKTFYDGAELKNKTKWLDVFDQLTIAINKTPRNKKIILFLDELPWMATKKSKLIQALDHYWNRYWSIDPRIKLIVCGSAASWILDNVVHNKGGLYNRITYQIGLLPLTLNESKKFLLKKGIKLNNSQILKLYMAIGGIPLYLDHVQKGLSADQNIENLCFTKRGLLLNEFNKLFASLFDQQGIHEEVIRLIATQRYGMSQMDIMKKSSKSIGGRLKKRLQELEESGFIERFVPYKHKEKGIYYRVVDEYTLFYLKWVGPIFNSIRNRDKEPGYWSAKQKSSSWESWAGYAFETICYKHLNLIRKKLNVIPGSEVGTWCYVPRKSEDDKQGAQIDLLFDRDDGVIQICEIKYSSTPYIIDKAYSKNLLRKADVFVGQTKTKKQIFICMVASNGLKKNLYAEELIDGVAVLDDLFVD